MFSTWRKATAAGVMAVVYFANQLFNIDIGLDEATVDGILVAVTPFIVWVVSNVKKAA